MRVSPLAQYRDLASLRDAMTSDEADQRVDAYMAVRDAGVDPDDVLTARPDESAVETLRETDVIGPEPTDDGMTAYEQRQRIIELLEDLGGSGGGE